MLRWRGSFLGNFNPDVARSDAGGSRNSLGPSVVVDLKPPVPLGLVDDVDVEPARVFEHLGGTAEVVDDAVPAGERTPQPEDLR
jgi:hypothetical protein